MKPCERAHEVGPRVSSRREVKGEVHMRRMPGLYLGSFAAISVCAAALVLLSAGAAHSLDLPDYNMWVQAFFRNRTGFFLDHAKSFDGKSATLDRFEQSLWLDAKKQFLD